MLVAHGAVDVLDPGPNRPSTVRLAALRDALDRGAVHYVALGTGIPLVRSATRGRIWYSGVRRRSPTTTTSESDPGHVLLVDIDADLPGRRLGNRRIGRWRFLTRCARNSTTTATSPIWT